MKRSFSNKVCNFKTRKRMISRWRYRITRSRVGLVFSMMQKRNTGRKYAFSRIGYQQIF